MQIITLVENLVYSSGLGAEHGLSFYLDCNDTKILFDVGQTDLFYKNAQKLDVPIEDVDFLVISHGHYDHVGGLSKFLKVNTKAKIVIHPMALTQRFNKDKNIGIDATLFIANERFLFLIEPYKISNKVTVVPNINIIYSEDLHRENFFVVKEGQKRKDRFIDELFLLIEKQEEVVVLSSCSHNGISNILETAKQYARSKVKTVIGGFHINNATKASLKFLVNYFNSSEIINIGVCHCTGVERFSLLKSEVKANVFYNHTGFTYQL